MTSTCNNAFQLLPHSPQSRITMTPKSAQTLTSPRRLTSPLKQRTPKCDASPRKAIRLTSPRKSPKKVLFHNSEQVSFTPQRTKQPPRAWERRPATPFVPRDEKQKIWKRVPLGELGIDINQPVGVSRREQDKSKDYTRVVKKLKTGHGGVDMDDKENQAVCAKTINEETVLKRSHLRSGDFISMKMEEDEILGSPKKKFRPPCQDDSSEGCTAAVIESELSADNFDEDVDDNDVETNAKTSEACSPQVSVANISQCDERTQINKYSSGATNSDVVVEAAELDEDTRTQEDEDHQQLQVDTSTEHDSSGIVLEEDSNHEGVIISAYKDEGTENISPTDSNDDLVTQTENDRSEEPQSSSPPTILAENVIVDELEFAELPSNESSTNEKGSIDVDHNAEEEIQDPPTSKPVSKRISDGETAYLQDFLLRTKAQKIAREHEISDAASKDEPVEQHEPEHVENHDDISLPESTGNSSLDILLSDPIYGITGSPIRRSTRACVTNLPRPSTLPNAIQLKRASGTEFIFTANKASSSANVALVTRTNTKQNKGSALNVRARLEQLVTGKDETEDSGADKEEREKNAGADRLTSKRKRSKNDNGRKARKALRWNDDNLVSYQEFQNNEAWDEDGSNSSQENTNSTLREDSSSNGSTRIKLTMNLPSSGTPNKTRNRDTTPEEGTQSSSTAGEASQSEHKDSSSQNRVRRARRGIVGSVNGTPGPKTRSKKPILESDVIDANSDEIKFDETLQESAAATVALSSLVADQTAKNNNHTIASIAAAPATRRSRIAVPSTRHNGHGTGNGVRSMRNAALGSSAENARGGEEKKSDDLLGRRRLRVRD